MLMKLLRYEWKATARTLLPLYGGVVLLAILNRLLWSPWISSSYSADTTPGWVQGIAMTVYIGIMVASFVITFVILIQRFYKSLLGDEGYLMFTLPVTPAQHIWAKTIIASLMSMLACVAAMLSICVLAGNIEFWKSIFGSFGELFSILFSNINYPIFVLEMLVLMIVGTISGMFCIYLCIALGHLASKHRVAMAVVAYFGLSIAGQIIMSMFFGMANNGLFSWVNGFSSIMAIHFSFFMLIAATAISGAVAFLGTNYILTNKLNLE